MLTCKLFREVVSGDVYKTIFPQSIKYFGLTNNTMAVTKTTAKHKVCTYRISIRTLDRKEYHLTDETFNYEAVNILAELIEAKLGFRKLKDRHLAIIAQLNEEDQVFFKDISLDKTMVHAKKLNETLSVICDITEPK